MLVVGWGCSTQKNALPNRLYHSINAKYNGYFNARESYRQGVRTLSETHQDNYDRILSIFRYGTPRQAGAIAGNMEVAYQKASTVIRKHSMNIRGVEYNPWIDTSFFLIARSHYFRRDFTLASLTFDDIARQYEGDIQHEARIWMAKCHHETEQYALAAQVLEEVAGLQRDGLLSKEANRLFSLVQADHFIRQEEHARAVPYLEQGILHTRSKRERTRLTYILAQLFQEAGRYPEAQEAYARVLRMNPSFDMAFQARISMASAFAPGEGGGDYIRSELTGMLRDDQNRPYRDQIYYALGELARRQGFEQQAMENYLLSTEVSEDNALQKGLSFLRLGELYFERPEYLQASIYYDSTLAYLPGTYEQYATVSQQKAVLSALAAQIRVVEREDSLQRLAAMPEDRREAIVEGIIEELREQERLAQEMEREQQRAAQLVAQTRARTGGTGTREAGWYFYNPSAMGFGRTEFFGLFGNRPLEDLWRISNKGMGADFVMEDDWDAAGEEVLQGDLMDKNTYLRNIPVTPEQLKASNERIAGALFSQGMIFKDRLNDYRAAARSFETLLARFPETERRLLAYYYLFSLHRELGDPSRGDVFKQRLLTEYPDSDYARILGDPNYLETLRARQEGAESLYASVYDDFISGRFQEVLRRTTGLDSLELENRLAGQFSFINALAKNRLGMDDAYREQLELVVREHPGSPVHEPAATLLASLESVPQTVPRTDADPGPEGPVESGFESIFSYEPETVHFYVFVLEGGRINANEFRNTLQAMHAELFEGRNLTSSSVFLDERRQLVTVTNFPGKEAGLEYHRAISLGEALSKFDTGSVRGFLISVANYPLFYQEKDVEAYLAFFRRLYLEE